MPENDYGARIFKKLLVIKKRDGFIKDYLAGKINSLSDINKPKDADYMTK